MGRLKDVKGYIRIIQLITAIQVIIFTLVNWNLNKDPSWLQQIIATLFFPSFNNFVILRPLINELYPQNNTQDIPQPLKSGSNSSYTQQEKA